VARGAGDLVELDDASIGTQTVLNRTQFVAATLIITLLVTGRVLGQIGQDADACARLWGASVGGQVDGNGFGTLQFESGDLSIEVDVVAGRVQRGVYRAPVLGDEAIRGILHRNEDGSKWKVYHRPGGDAVTNRHPMWSRTDESAMAELVDGTLTILGSGWYQHLVEHGTALSTNTPVAGSEDRVPEVISTNRMSRQGEETSAVSRAMTGESGHVSRPVFDRIPDPPRWIPPRPSVLPTQGESLQNVLLMLGQPNGTLSSGKRKVLLYSWGKVWIVNGVVEDLE
jgi:hypothetical protein